VNSLIGMPNPIAATPAVAITIPSNVKITDMRRSPTLAMMIWLLKILAPFGFDRNAEYDMATAESDRA
jgi:hypothetical protein